MTEGDPEGKQPKEQDSLPRIPQAPPEDTGQRNLYLDAMQFGWDSLEEFALDKTGIIPSPPIPDFLTRLQPQELQNWVESHPRAAIRFSRRLASYKQQIKAAVQRLANEPDTRFLLRALLDRLDEKP